MKYLYEFIGTFFLTLTIGMSVLGANNAGALAPLAIGSILAVFVYAGGHISGAHYNPAVSLAVYIRGKLSSQDLFFYWGAQILAGLVGGALTLYFKGAGAATPLQLDTVKSLLAEFLFTFALAFVVLNVATAKATNNNSYFGFAIGFTVLAGAYAVGTISGGAFNPAVAVSLAVLNLTTFSDLWIFIVANLFGASTAALLFKAAHPNE